MQQGRKWTAVDHKPGNEGANLGGVEDIYLEHTNRMRPNWVLEKRVDPQLGKLQADSSVELFCEEQFARVRRKEVDVDVETASHLGVCNGRRERGI